MAKKSVSSWMQPGQIVDVIAPASSCDADLLQSGLDFIKTWGLEPRHAPGFMQPDHYVAQSEEFRWSDLKRALFAPDSQVVWAARGGFGCAHLVPRLMKLKKPRRRKLVVGFSDLTVVQTFLMQKWGWPVLHTTMVSGLAQQPLWYSDRLREVLFSARAQIQAELLPLNERAARAGLVRGSVVGGNMKLIQCLVKTPLHPRFHGKIVFFEDINERGYSLDRMLTHMTQVGLFKGVRAVVFGDFTQGLEPDGKSYVQTALQSFADRAAFPVLSGYPFGHGENRLPVPMGTKAQLRLGPRSSLDIAGPPAP